MCRQSRSNRNFRARYSEHVHQRGDAIIRKICHQAFESEPFDGRIVGVPCQKVENVCLIGVHKRQV